jgi:two-component system OmpR family response regulator
LFAEGIVTMDALLDGSAQAEPAARAPARVLVVDDHADIREPLAQYLVRCGLQVAGAASAAGMHAQLAAQRFDLVVLDIMLPDADGLSLCRHVSGTLGLPVILLTARAALPDRVAGLQTGADDYVVKPFEPSELLARIQAVLRRQSRAAAAPARATRLRFDGWTFDLARRSLHDVADQPLPLSEAEFQLLAVLVAHANEVLSRDRLLDLTQRSAQSVFDRSIDTQISRLRRKLEADPRRPALIKTAWGNGYIFVADVRPLPA